MRKIILAPAVSLDGYIARENGDVDWLAMEDLQKGASEMNDFFSSIDTIYFDGTQILRKRFGNERRRKRWIWGWNYVRINARHQSRIG